VKSNKQMPDATMNGATYFDKPASSTTTTGSLTMQTTTTFDDLMSALKDLEAEDQLPAELCRQQKSQHTLSWCKLTFCGIFILLVFTWTWFLDV